MQFSELGRRFAGVLAGPLAPAGARVLVSTELQAALQTMGGAGRMGRLWRDWILRPLESIDKEVLRDLRRARRASRELVGTWGPAARWMRLAEENIVGLGVRLRAQLTKSVEGQPIPDVRRNARVEDAWRRWCRKECCDVAGRWSWPTIERLFAKGWARDGEALLRIVEGFDNAFGFAVQLLDPDQLDDRYNVPAGPGQNEIRAGVEIDPWMRPLAYHVYTTHPADFLSTAKRERIPASQIVHWFEPLRAGQTRGLPRLLASLVAAKLTMGYEEAEVTAARSNAIRMGFYKRSAESVVDPRSPLANVQDRIFDESEPGAWGILPIGWEAQDLNSTHPTSNFGPFMKAMVRSIASGICVSYNTIGNDAEGVNFSSLRSFTLVDRDRYQVDQAEMIDALHETVFARWLVWAITTGQIAAKDADVLERHTWQPRGWPWVDPLKDIQAEILAVRAGLNSRTRAAAERGVDIEEVMQELAAEKKLAQSLGLQLETDLGGRPIQDAPAEGGDGNGGDTGTPPDDGRSLAGWNRAGTGSGAQGPTRSGHAGLPAAAAANGRGPHPPA